MPNITDRQWRYSTATETFTLDLDYSVTWDGIDARWLEITQENPQEPWVLNHVEGSVGTDGVFNGKTPAKRELLDINVSLHYLLAHGYLFAKSHDQQFSGECNG